MRKARTFQLDTGWHFIESPGVWEMEVPNADYEVTVTMGESLHAFKSVVNTVDIEGVPAIEGFIATSSVRTEDSHRDRRGRRWTTDR